MPTYEYECTKCDNRFETSQNMVDKPLRDCPKCGGPLRRLISAGGGIIFKGPGFYATDYRNKEYKKKEREEKESAKSKDESPKDTKKDTKKISEGED